MKNRQIIKELLSLSKRHLQLTLEENWDEWESVAEQKEALHKKLLERRDESIDKEETDLIAEIETLEEQTKEQLQTKKKEINLELTRTKKLKHALKGYDQAKKRPAARHFKITG